MLCIIIIPLHNPSVYNSYHIFPALGTLTARSRVLSEKLTVPQLIKNFVVFIGNRRFIYSAFTSVRSSPRPCVIFHNVVSEEFLAPRPHPLPADHPLSSVRDCLFNIFAATLHIWKSFIHMESEDALCRGYNGPLKWTFFCSNEEDLPVYRFYDKPATSWSLVCFGGIAALILHLGSLHSSSKFPQSGQRARGTAWWSSKSMWMLCRRANTLVPAGNRTTIPRTSARHLVTISVTEYRRNAALMDTIKTCSGSWAVRSKRRHAPQTACSASRSPSWQLIRRSFLGHSIDCRVIFIIFSNCTWLHEAEFQNIIVKLIRIISTSSSTRSPQEPAAASYPEPGVYSPHPRTLFI